MTHEPPFAVENWEHWQPGLRRVPSLWLPTQRKLQSLSRASRSDHHVFIPSHDFMMGPRQWDGGGGMFGCGGDLGGGGIVGGDNGGAGGAGGGDGLGGGTGGLGGAASKSCSAVMMWLATGSKRWRLGRMVFMVSASLTPNHCARACQMPSHGMVGISRPVQR